MICLTRRLFALLILTAAVLSLNSGVTSAQFRQQQCGPNGCTTCQRSPVCSGPNCQQAYRAPVRKAVAMTVGWGYDALDQLNAQRRARGLRPYRRDRGLTLGAMHAAQYRAKRGIAGHCGDFSFLPAGSSAPVAGCAAWPVGSEFGACAAYENWSHAGAASCVGADGRVYHQLFVK